MGIESGGGLGADPTLRAIYEITHTLGSGGDTVPAPVGHTAAAAGVPSGPAQPNREVEKLLIEEGMLAKGSLLKRTVLGCVACQQESGGEQGISLTNISQCHGRRRFSIKRVLNRLVEAGVLVEVDGTVSTTISADDRYVLAPTADTVGFRDKLEKPEQCGLEGRSPDTLNMAAEQALVAAKIIEKRSATRRSALGCIACRIQSGEEGAHILGVEQCRGINHDSVFRLFGVLAEKGALKTQMEKRNRPGRRRVIYAPADNELGTQLRELLEKPEQCGLRQQPEQEDA